MSWHCLQEQAEGFSVERYLAGVALARLRSRNTPAACCSNGSETGCCRRSRFGTMCAPSMADHGEVSWMSSPAGSPAKTSAAPERGPGSQGHEAGFGARCTELLARYDHAMHSWKTPQCSLLAGLDEFSETWTKSGMMLHGCAYRLPIAAPRTSARESGFSPVIGTPVTKTHGSRSERFRRGVPTIDEFLKLPKAQQDAIMGRGRMIPTPNAQDFRSGFKDPEKRAEYLRKGHQLHLNHYVAMFPTPTCHDAKLAHPAPNKTAQGSPCLTERVLTEDGHNGGTLNPTWVEWLMGWPLGWTDLKPLGTDRFRSWLQQHSRCCSES